MQISLHEAHWHVLPRPKCTEDSICVHSCNISKENLVMWHLQEVISQQKCDSVYTPTTVCTTQHIKQLLGSLVYKQSQGKQGREGKSLHNTFQWGRAQPFGERPRLIRHIKRDCISVGEHLNMKCVKLTCTIALGVQFVSERLADWVGARFLWNRRIWEHG